MANEAIQVEGPYNSHDLTVATGTAIPQFSLLQLSDPRTGAISDGANIFGGITLTEKTTTDAVVDLGVCTSGYWNLKDAGAGGSAGAMVVLSGANLIRDAVAGELLTGAIVGKRMQDAAASEVTEIHVGAFA